MDRCGWPGWCRIRPRRSARCCAGMAARVCRARGPPAAHAAMSASGRASSCTWTRRSSGASGNRASACSASRPDDRKEPTRRLAAPARRDRRPLAAGLAELLPARTPSRCSRFLERASAWYREQGIVVERVLTDNAKAYHSRAWIETTAGSRSSAATRASTRPRTNGKAERFIQTLLSEWAYARSYPIELARARALSGYLRWYNRRRPHSSLGARPPISRVSHLCGHDS